MSDSDESDTCAQPACTQECTEEWLGNGNKDQSHFSNCDSFQSRTVAIATVALHGINQQMKINGTTETQAYTSTIKAEQISQPISPSSAELSQGSALLCRELSNGRELSPFRLELSKCVPSSSTERYLSMDVDIYFDFD